MNERMVEYLLSEGVRVVADDVRAATLSRVKPIIRLLLEHGWPINAKSGWYDPPVLAYVTEDLELTRWFLSQNADPNAQCGIDRTPLSIGIQKGSVAVIEMLFAHGGTIHCGQLLHWAASRQKDDRLAVVNILLRKGALLNAIMYENDEDSFIQREPFGLGTPLHVVPTRFMWPFAIRSSSTEQTLFSGRTSVAIS
ncbi:Putative ankyrin repeat-containing domain superfamily [Septoria linicola]|uniref:Ankyrin repeat-containing domain superfamily n=1 Tax=Septoria linicola TaxID=215465 RepID=A0A9Q9B9Z3_9PEZI|nr:Putative ankyrin repeat-containing domain superfamily [Septoria linicola]